MSGALVYIRSSRNTPFLFPWGMVYFCSERQVSGMPYSVDELRQIIDPIARQHGIKSISLFGSYARGESTAASDVDLKIEKGALKTLYQLCAFRLDLEDALHLPVDLVTSDASDPAFLGAIAKEEVLLYPGP